VRPPPPFGHSFPLTRIARSAGGTQRLSRLLGPARAKDLIFTARILDAPAALQIGLVSAVARPGQTASDRATELAREIIPSGACDAGVDAHGELMHFCTAPLAVRAAKTAIDTGSQLDLESGLDLERACYATILLTQDRLEGLAAFAEKRKPVFRGK
jgi:methylglutaconyl-CoA hydratase